MNKIQRAVGSLSIAALAVLSLTACSAEKFTFNGSEVKETDKSLQRIDDQWRSTVTQGAPVNVHDDARCFFQTAESAIAPQAICGPVHFLGDDESTWMSTALSFQGTSLVADGEFSSGASFSPGTSTFGLKNSKPADGTELSEPPATRAVSLGEILDVTSPGLQTREEGTLLRTPDLALSVNGVDLSKRVGDATDRVSTEGGMFVSLSMNVKAISPDSTEEFAEDGSADLQKTKSEVTLRTHIGGKAIEYPLKSVPSGSFAVAVEGDPDRYELVLTYAGEEQTIDLATLERTPAVGAAYYDEIANKLEVEYGPTMGRDLLNHGRVESPDKDPKWKLSVTYDLSSTERTAFYPELGWAPKDKAWIIVNNKPGMDKSEYVDKYSHGLNWTINESKQTLTPKGGQPIKPSASPKDPNDESLISVFEVPASSYEFTFASNQDIELEPAEKFESSPDLRAPFSKVSKTIPLKDLVISFDPEARDKD